MTVYQSPLGPLTLVGGPGGLRALHFPETSLSLDDTGRDGELLAPVVDQLDAYFAGRRVRFEVGLDLTGTPFQLRVWRELMDIPYGTTLSYGDLARAIGRPDRARAVGAAVGRTPVPIIIPCHRMVAADGALTGYRGGLARKRALLDLESSAHQLKM